MAFDKRDYDPYGRLRVTDCTLSAAVVNGYYGYEIDMPDLEPDKIYQMWRHPESLAAAAPTFAGVPLMIRHVATTAEAPQKELIAGTVGTDVTFDGHYLRASLMVWDADAIEGIERNEQRELSCGYRYTADMTPGVTPDGIAYDGIMRNIICNHVALVVEGRAGPDVCVNDEAPKTMKLTKLLKLLLDEALEKEKKETEDEGEPAQRIRDMCNGKLSDSEMETLGELLEALGRHEKEEAEDEEKTEEEEKEEANDALPDRIRAIREAERAVLPFVGELTQVYDNAPDVYKLALVHSEIALDGVPPEAYKAMVSMLPLPSTVPAQIKKQAMDEAAVEPHPLLNRLG